MSPDLVVDVGNTRIKWGHCGSAGVVNTVSLAPDDPASWESQLQRWNLSGRSTWAISSVQPLRRQRFAAWLMDRGQECWALDDWQQLPLAVRLSQPERVGIDRLLNAVAANTQRRQGRGAIIIDAGTAVTVDLVDETGAFRGGTIFPGLRLMAQALHEHTALLPLVEISAVPPVLGEATPEAIRAGVFHAVSGGIHQLVEMLSAFVDRAHIFLTGGDARLLHKGDTIGYALKLWPEMTLEGIRLAAEAQP